MEQELLLAPVAPDDPAGPDLSYDSGRQAIEAVFDAPSDESDWPRVIAMIEAQARATRDAWLGVYLARAGAHSGDLATIEAGASLLAGLFEQLWDAHHPSIAEYGVEGRKGACESLVRIGEFLAPLRRVPLLQHARLGSFSGADFERFAAGGAMEDGYGPFRAALADTPVDHLAETVARLRRIREAVERADTVLSLQAEAVGQTGTNFRATYEALDSLIEAVATYAGSSSDEQANGQGEGAAMSQEMPVSDTRKASAVGRVNGREDVARALDAIMDYYARAEPSSPIPVALARVKGWIAMDFVSILNDIAPGSVSEASNVLRARGSQDDGGSDLM